jgi:hypothetical protein
MATSASIMNSSTAHSIEKDDRPSSPTTSTRDTREGYYEDDERYSMTEMKKSTTYDNLPSSPASVYQDEDTENRREHGRRRGETSRNKTARRSEDDEQSTTLTVWCTLVLLMELGGAMLAVIYYEDLIECCGESFISDSDSTAQKWNSAMFGIGIGYLVLIIIEIPIMALKQEPVFLFNPMIGFLLSVHMLYVTETLYSYIIFGLESAAMLGQSFILIQMQRSSELCIHALFNYTMCGLVAYLIIEMTRQGGYCIVDGQLQSVFQDSTCDMGCVDDASCFVCTTNSTSCFIRFSS